MLLLMPPCFHRSSFINLDQKKQKSPIFETGYIRQQNKQKGNIYPVSNICCIAHDATRDAQFPQTADTMYFSQIKQQLNLFTHKFSVKSPDQYQMQYDVSYRYVQEKKFSINQEKCEYCFETATCYCLQDNQFFCTSCYQSNHRSAQKHLHQQKTITPFNSVPLCPLPNHSKSRMQMYCFQCKRLVCSVCLLHQHQKHQTIQILELATLFSERQESVLKELKSKVSGLIGEVETKIQTLNSELAIKERELEDKFKIRLEKVRQETSCQISQMVGLHSFLIRKYDEYLWIEKFVNYVGDYLVTQQNIQIKQAFTTYIDFSSPKQQFKKFDKLLIKITQPH